MKEREFGLNSSPVILHPRALLLALLCLLAACALVQAQEQQQEQVQVFTEEVRLPIFVTDEHGRFDPSLEMDDVVVVEDDVPQEIKSLRRIPANVLLLLDTGNQLTLAKSVQTMRDISMQLIENLAAESRIAVMQFSNRAELLQDWTSDRKLLEQALRTKLYSGKSTRLSEAAKAAAAKLSSLPAGSRHVVLITDGVETSSGSVVDSAAFKQLIAAQATVHVISYTALTRELVRQRYPASILRAPPKQNPPTESIPVGDPTMPQGQTRSPSYKILSIDTDAKRRRQARDYAKATEQSEARLTSLAEETGGRVLLPKTLAEMLREGAEVAREIDAQYVITYRPKRPLSAARPGEYRRVSVALRRPGLTVHARRGYTVTR